MLLGIGSRDEGLSGRRDPVDGIDVSDASVGPDRPEDEESADTPGSGADPMTGDLPPPELHAKAKISNEKPKARKTLEAGRSGKRNRRIICINIVVIYADILYPAVIILVIHPC